MSLLIGQETSVRCPHQRVFVLLKIFPFSTQKGVEFKPYLQVWKAKGLEVFDYLSMEDMFQARRPNLTSVAEVVLYYRYHSVLVVSLGPGSVVGGKGQKRGQMGKISASQAVAWGGGKDYLLARFAHRFFFLFPAMRSLVPG